MLIPSAEAVTLKHLKARLGSAATVVVEVPAKKVWPLVRVTRYGGAPAVGTPLVLDTADMQIDVFAERKMVASDLSGLVRDALADMAGRHELQSGPAWVTGTQLGAMRYEPDDTYDPALPRYTIDCRVWIKAYAS